MGVGVEDSIDLKRFLKKKEKKKKNYSPCEFASSVGGPFQFHLHLVVREAYEQACGLH